MRWAAVFATVGLCAGLSPASAEQLVVTLSTDRVEITSNFTGTSVTLFGAVERDPATPAGPRIYDIAVVARGPLQSVVARRKERFLGIWINRSSETLIDVPAFYSVRASRALTEIAEPEILAANGIGLDRIELDREDGEGVSPEFREGFLRLKERQNLYRQEIGSVDFPGADIFKSAIPLPANVPVGLYTTSVYLFSGRRLLAESHMVFTVNKSGFEEAASGFARNQAVFYGLACVAAALAIGWLGGVIFRRD